MVLLALTGLFCIAAETYLFFAIPIIRKTTRIFNRSFIVDYRPLLVMCLVLVSLLVAMLSYFIYLTFLDSLPPPRAEPPPSASPEIVRQYHRANMLYEEKRGYDRSARMTFIALLLLPLSTVAIAIPMVGDLSQAWSGGEYRVKLSVCPASVIGEFFPKTNASIMDLDQAVALLAGMTVVGFGLYSAAEERYRRWWEAEKKRLNSRARQMADNTRPEHGRALDALDGLDPEEIELHELRPNGGRR
jgi:hypothetical protein